MDDIDLEIDDGLADFIDIDEFINNQIPCNTKYANTTGWNALHRYMKKINENRQANTISAAALDKILSGFFINGRKQDGSDYKPDC